MEARRRAIGTTGCVSTWRDDKIVYDTEIWGFRFGGQQARGGGDIVGSYFIDLLVPVEDVGFRDPVATVLRQVVSDEPSTHIPSTRECGGCTLTGEHCSERVANRC